MLGRKETFSGNASDSKNSLEVTGEANAIIVFFDIIESAKYSTVLGIKEYAKRVVMFHEEFNKLYNTYFPEEQTETSFITHTTRGDEGIIFCISPDIGEQRLMYRILEFAFELKATLLLIQKGIKNPPPFPMDIGTGIHLGPVATLSYCNTNPVTIDSIEGLAINYGKRIETASRKGKYSKIFMSRDAIFYLDGEPVALNKNFYPLKGINDEEPVFEVRSALLENIPKSKRYLELFENEFVNTDDARLTREAWMNSVTLSMLCNYIQSSSNNLKSAYQDKLSRFIWRDISEDDPLMLFYRAEECEKQGKLTQTLDYLRTASKMYPSFVQARKKLSEVCLKIEPRKGNYMDYILARDTAEQFLTHFLYYLDEDEVQRFQKIREMEHMKLDEIVEYGVKYGNVQ